MWLVAFKAVILLAKTGLWQEPLRRTYQVPLGQAKQAVPLKKGVAAGQGMVGYRL